MPDFHGERFFEDIPQGWTNSELETLKELYGENEVELLRHSSLVEILLYLLNEIKKLKEKD